MVNFTHSSGPFPYLYDPIADLYDKWYNEPWDEQKNAQYLFMKQIPFISWNMNIYEGKKENSEYLKNSGVGWSGVKKPYNLPGNSKMIASFGAGYNFVSSNVTRLYK